jgi:integrase
VTPERQLKTPELKVVQASVRKKKKRSWPNIYPRTHRSGSISWVVDLGEIDGKRQRHSFLTKEEANTCAEQAKIKKVNEGLTAFGLPADVRHDAAKAHLMLKDHGITLVKAAEYYLKHVVRFKEAPVVKEIAAKMLADAEENRRRARTLSDLKSRLGAFAADFGESKLINITLEDLKDWISDDDWAPRTRINYLTKVSQLFNYAIKHGWAEKNLIEMVDRPDVEDEEPGILTVSQCKTLLEESIKYGLRPYIAIGLFAGLRSAELLRLKGEAINFQEKVVIVGSDVAKKRSRRTVEMCDALISWLKPVLPIKGPIVEASKFRENMEGLKKAAGMTEWPHNALRHSFGSYHLAFYGDQVKTAQQMGHRDASVVHNHYKALVLKSEAEKFWTTTPAI